MRMARGWRVQVRLAQEALAAEQKKRLEAEEDATRSTDANHELLQKLLAEQRAQLKVDTQELHDQAASEEEARKAVEEELGAMRKQLSGATMKLKMATDGKASAETDLQQVRVELTKTKEEIVKGQKESEQLRKDLATKVKELAAKEKAAKPKPPPAAEKKVKQGVLGRIDLDEGPDAPPISEQLADALKKGAGKVIDLFREWDEDGDGEVTRKEFHAAMPKLGLDVPKEAIDELFSSWDNDGGGALDFKELQKILRTPVGTKLKASGAAAGVAAKAGKK